MSRTPVNWMGESRPASSATVGAFRELARSRDILAAREALALRTAGSRQGLFSTAWRTFTAAFVVMMLASQLVPLPPGHATVAAAKNLADSLRTSSH